jgi:chromate transporter
MIASGVAFIAELTSMNDTVANNPLPEAGSRPIRISFREAFWFWLKLGFISFGGPAGQIAILADRFVKL